MAKRVTKKVAKKVAAKKPLPFLEPEEADIKTLEQRVREAHSGVGYGGVDEKHTGPNWPMIALIAFVLVFWYAVFRYFGFLP